MEAQKEREIIISERIDCLVRIQSIQPYIFHRLKELGVDPVGFVTEFWNQHKNQEIGENFLTFGLKYNEVFNKRLKREEGFPTWRNFIEDCFKDALVKYEKDIDSRLARERAGLMGKGLPV